MNRIELTVLPQKPLPNKVRAFGFSNGLHFRGPLLLVLCAMLFVVSCNSDDDGGGDPMDDFDRAAMLENVGTNIIIPRYEAMEEATTMLLATAQLFEQGPDEVKLNALQDAWKNTAIAWQSCSPFEFGPASDQLLRTSVNTFPTNQMQIQSNIASGNYDLTTANNIDAQGLPALDYLLFGLGTTDAEIVSFYTTNASSPQFKQYLLDLVTAIDTKVRFVNTSWPSTYLAEFKSNTGTDVGSSLGFLVNELNFDYELIKTAKVGIPLGKKTLGIAQPEKVEAFYSGISAELALASFRGIEQLYRGMDAKGNNGLGLDDHLSSLGAKYNGGSLVEAIDAQLALVASTLAPVPDPLSATIQNSPNTVDAAYTELQKMIVLFKTDMPSALGVLITYQDNDGD